MQNPGRTYKFYTGTPNWPFAHSRSYTDFSVRWTAATAGLLSQQGVLEHTTDKVDGLEFEVEVTNTGSVAGAKALHAFISAGVDEDEGAHPLLSLWALKKVYLMPGASTTVRISTAEHDWCPFCTVDTSGLRAVRPSAYHLRVGGDGSVDGGDGCAPAAAGGAPAAAGDQMACARLDVQLLGEAVSRQL